VKVRLRSDGTPAGTTVETMDGKAIRGVKRAVYAISVDGEGGVELDLHPRCLDLDVLAEWHPSIEWANTAAAEMVRRVIAGVRDVAREHTGPALLDLIERGLRDEGLL
jgi:hypothetical protein